MPCESAYLEPTYDEVESKRVCELICFVFGGLKLSVPGWIIEASKDDYGNSSRLTEAESVLYKTIVSLNKDELNFYVYNPRVRKHLDKDEISNFLII